MAPAASQEQAQDVVAVVVVPFTAQSHLAQLLHLSLLLCGRPGLSVHYATSPTHLRQVKSRLHPAWSSSAASQLHFHELPIPPFPSPPPDPHRPCTKFPAHLQPMFDAFDHMRAPLSALLRSLSASSRRLVVVHDPLASFAAAEAATLGNAESYTFRCVPAIFQIVFGRPSAADELRDCGLALPSSDGIITEEFAAFVRRHKTETVPVAGTLLNTCRTIEGEFIDLLAQEPEHRGKKLFTIGPMSPMAILLDKGGHRVQRHECLDWLDKQPQASVVYVSFGTTTAMSDEQLEELANGLLRSRQRFIWVVRDADRGDIFAAENNGNSRLMSLPPELEEEVKRAGMVVRGWAPQLDILAHPSTGAFMSHCGWNSCMEGLCMGVPVIAWPMHSDQPTNAALVTDHLKVGVAVREWTPRDEVVGSAEIEEAVKKVMVYEEGKGIRARSKVLGEAVRAAVAAEGGASRAELDAFVAHIIS